MSIGFWKRLWEDIRQGRNIEVYVTVVLCFAVIVLNTLGIVESQIVASAILAVLSLESVSLLTNRRTEQELRSSLEELAKRQQKPRIADVISPFGEGISERTRQLATADEVWILSRTCRRIWSDYQEELRTVAQRGGLRLLLIDPSDGAVEMVARSAIWQQPDDGAMLKLDIERFLDRLERIQGTVRLNKFEVRVINYLPAWTLILVNPGRSDGVIYVELATYRSHSRKRPTFAVRCGYDNDLFEQFRYEFEQMWNDAQPAWRQAVA